MERNKARIRKTRKKSKRFKKKNLISVILSTYNRSTLLKQAIYSVLKQTYKNFELIIIDDGSIDNTENTVKQFNDKRIQYFKNFENTKNLPAVRNKGVKHSKGKYIAYLDDDNIWYENHLEVLLDFLIKEKVDLVYCDSKKNDQANFSKFHSIYVPKQAIDFNYDELLKQNFIDASDTLMTWECFNDVGGWDEDFKEAWEDWEMWLRIGKKFKIKHICKVLSEYCLHEDSMTGRVLRDGLSNMCRIKIRNKHPKVTEK